MNDLIVKLPQAPKPLSPLHDLKVDPKTKAFRTFRLFAAALALALSCSPVASLVQAMAPRQVPARCAGVHIKIGVDGVKARAVEG